LLPVSLRLNNILLLIICAAGLSLFSIQLYGQPDGKDIYYRFCAQCHGADLDGGNASSLVDGIWQYGAGEGYITRNIKYGIPHLGMPPYEKSLSYEEIRAVVKYIHRAEESREAEKPALPDVLKTMNNFMDMETFADGLEIP